MKRNSTRNWSIGLVFLACLVVLLNPSPATAKKGSVGISLGHELFIHHPSLEGNTGQLLINIFLSYYPNAYIGLLASFEADLEPSAFDDNDKGATLGVSYYPFPYYIWIPYVRAEFMTVLDPDKAIGHRFALGVNYDLFQLMGTRGVYLFYQLGVKSIYLKTAGPSHSFEFFRLGVEFSF